MVRVKVWSKLNISQNWFIPSFTSHSFVACSLLSHISQSVSVEQLIRFWLRVSQASLGISSIVSKINFILLYNYYFYFYYHIYVNKTLSFSQLWSSHCSSCAQRPAFWQIRLGFQKRHGSLQPHPLITRDLNLRKHGNSDEGIWLWNVEEGRCWMKDLEGLWTDLLQLGKLAQFCQGMPPFFVLRCADIFYLLTMMVLALYGHTDNI